MNDKEKKITAYHEGGHALVAAALPHTDPVHKVTILPRGRALGYTMVLPTDDKYSTTRNEMLDQLAYMLGGRVAEELVFHDPTTGAANDIEKATGAGPRDGHAVRHERADRRDQARPGAAARSSSAATWATSATTPRRSPASSTRRSASSSRTPTTRPGRSSSRTATSSTRWSLELLEQETLDKEELAEIFAPVRQAAARARSGCPASAARSRDMPARCSHPRSGPRPNGHGTHGAPTLRAGADRSGPGRGGPARRPTASPTRRLARPSIGPPGDARTSRPRPAAVRRRPAPRPPSASCSSRSARTPTARACATPPAGSPGRTARSSPGCGRSPATC